MNVIYTRVMGIQQARDVNVGDVLQFELAPVPTSMFNENGDMRVPKSKSTLKRNYQVECSTRLAIRPKVTVIDGCAVLWIVHWPNRGTVLDFVKTFTNYILGKLETSDVYLVF